MNKFIAPCGRVLAARRICLVVAIALLAGCRPHVRTVIPASPNVLPQRIDVGSAAPEFRLKELKTGETVRLSSLRGKPVVLAFGSFT
jgi:hypothetical protein